MGFSGPEAKSSTTQAGSENAGDLKDIPYSQQQVLAGQAYVEYLIPLRLRHGRRNRALSPAAKLFIEHARVVAKPLTRWKSST
jgi:hypothetical protein